MPVGGRRWRQGRAGQVLGAGPRAQAWAPACALETGRWRRSWAIRGAQTCAYAAPGRARSAGATAWPGRPCYEVHTGGSSERILGDPVCSGAATSMPQQHLARNGTTGRVGGGSSDAWAWALSLASLRRLHPIRYTHGGAKGHLAGVSQLPQRRRGLARPAPVLCQAGAGGEPPARVRLVVATPTALFFCNTSSRPLHRLSSSGSRQPIAHPHSHTH